MNKNITRRGFLHSLLVGVVTAITNRIAPDTDKTKITKRSYPVEGESVTPAWTAVVDYDPNTRVVTLGDTHSSAVMSIDSITGAFVVVPRPRVETELSNGSREDSDGKRHTP